MWKKCIAAALLSLAASAAFAQSVPRADCQHHRGGDELRCALMLPPRATIANLPSKYVSPSLAFAAPKQNGSGVIDIWLSRCGSPGTRTVHYKNIDVKVGAWSTNRIIEGQQPGITGYGIDVGDGSLCVEVYVVSCKLEGGSWAKCADVFGDGKIELDIPREIRGRP